MKRALLCIMLSVVLSVSFGAFGTFGALPAAAEDTENAEDTGKFVSVRAEYPEGEEYYKSDFESYDRICARYKDDKTLIPLSAYYDGYIYASVPEKYKNREIEGSVQNEVVFLDQTDDYEFYVMSKLAAKGVIKGDDKKKANPFATVTRAEATAMTLRLAGIETEFGTDSGFSDVDKASWYAAPITAAAKCGIVNGDSAKTFSPDRNVTLEEMTTMVYRSFVYAGLFTTSDADAATLKEQLDEKCNNNIRDTDKIASWALPAYNAFGYHSIFETEYDESVTHDEGYEGDDYFYPQRAATRFETARLLLSANDFFQVYPSQLAVEYGFDKQMPVIDGSTSTYPFTESLYTYLFHNGYYAHGKPLKHSKSHASYERLINGEVDMLFESAAPAEDITDLAKEKGVELEFIPIAYDAMIFFTNKDNPADNITQQQIKDIYIDNAYTNWKQIGGPDALLYPYCRNNDSGSNAQMERRFLNGKQINEKIRVETTSVSMSNILTDVMSAKTDNPAGYGLGYSIYYYFNNMDVVLETNSYLKLLSIDGVKPSDESIADGSYPLSNNTYLVLRASEPENSPARKVARFMLTEDGQTVVENAGYGPLGKTKNPQPDQY